MAFVPDAMEQLDRQISIHRNASVGIKTVVLVHVVECRRPPDHAMSRLAQKPGESARAHQPAVAWVNGKLLTDSC